MVMDNAIKIASDILLPCGLFFAGVILNWMREDIKGIREDMKGIRGEVKDAVQKVFDHVSDHTIHCKHLDHKGT